jgi:hypothetical protein
MAGLDRTTFYRLMERYQLNRDSLANATEE